MTKSLFRALVLSFAAATHFLVAMPSSAASISFTDNNCAGFAVTGTAPNFTLTCQALACTLTAFPAAPTPNQGVTFTPSCTGGSGTITYSFLSQTTGCPILTTAATFATAISATAVGPCTYRVNATDQAQLTGTATATVTWSSTPPSIPAGCLLTPSTTSLPAGGGNVTLTASCSSGGTATSYSWTGAGVVTPTAANSQVVNVTATTLFSVTPSNGSGNGNTATASVTVGGGGGGGALPTTCTINGTSYSVLDVGNMTPDGNRTSSSGFNKGKVVIATLVPPAGLSTNTNTISVFEWGGAPTSRKAYLATTPCPATLPGWPAYAADTGPVFNYSIGGFDPSAVNMKVGEKWYLIVVNEKPFGGNSCATGSSCDIGIKWYRPF